MKNLKNHRQIDKKSPKNNRKITEKSPKNSQPPTLNTKHKNLQFTSKFSILSDIFDTQKVRDETPRKKPSIQLNFLDFKRHF